MLSKILINSLFVSHALPLAHIAMCSHELWSYKFITRSYVYIEFGILFIFVHNFDLHQHKIWLDFTIIEHCKDMYLLFLYNNILILISDCI